MKIQIEAAANGWIVTEFDSMRRDKVEVFTDKKEVVLHVSNLLGGGPEPAWPEGAAWKTTFLFPTGEMAWVFVDGKGRCVQCHQQVDWENGTHECPVPVVGGGQ